MHHDLNVERKLDVGSDSYSGTWTGENHFQQRRRQETTWSAVWEIYQQISSGKEHREICRYPEEHIL